MITCVGYKNGRYLIEESEKGVELRFLGRSAEEFEQVNVPRKPKNKVDFSLTVEDLRTGFPGFLPEIN
jgi:hypothetical protein